MLRWWGLTPSEFEERDAAEQGFMVEAFVAAFGLNKEAEAE